MSESREGMRATPELRTQPGTAIALCVSALAALVIAIFAAGQLESLLGSRSGAIAVLAVWCVIGCAAAICAVVDAYLKPEGERLNLATTVTATVFAVLALAIVSGVVAGAANLGADEPSLGIPR